MVVLGDAGTDAPRHRESVESSMVQSVCPTLIYAMQNRLRHAYVATCVDGSSRIDKHPALHKVPKSTRHGNCSQFSSNFDRC